jgi:hypothetical protein
MRKWQMVFFILNERNFYNYFLQHHTIFGINIYNLQTSQVVWMPSNLTYRNIPGIPNLSYIWSCVNSFPLWPCITQEKTPLYLFDMRLVGQTKSITNSADNTCKCHRQDPRGERKWLHTNYVQTTETFLFLIWPANQKYVYKLKSALLRVVKHYIVVNPYQRFGTIYQSHLQGSRNPKRTDMLSQNIGEDLPLCVV